MKIKDRFLDYWNSDLRFEDYKYDLSIFEQMIYGIAGTLAGVIGVFGALITLPLWGVPYAVYKAIKARECY